MNARYLLITGLGLLAILGLGSVLIRDPLSLIRNLIISAVIIGIFVLIYRKWISGKPSNKEQKAFTKAAKQSKKKIKNKSALPSHNVLNAKKKSRKKSTAKLTVIEGKKNKKNRASF